MNTIELDNQYVASTYKRFPIEIVSGKGSLVKDVNGKEYIDMGSGIAVTSFGVADDEWIAAVEKQIHSVQHMSNLFYTAPCANLAKALCDKTGMSKVFFSNSGAEANECAIKVARKWAAEHKGPACSTIVTLEQSFHGRTLTTLAATGQDHFHELFQPLTPGFASFPAGDMDALKKLCANGTVAAVLIEMVQGEGGVIALDPAFVKELAAFLKEQDILLMVDEVQTGNGRTGTMYAYMQYGLQPDVVSTAKGLAGGLPMGATLMSGKVKDVLSYGDHGSTFGGNPIAAAAALSIVERLTDDFLADVTRKSQLIRSLLEGAPGIESISGLGLMIGLKTTKPAAEVLAACRENGVLCLTAKDKVRLLPALNIPDELLIKAADVIKAACK
ncbi:acetylornithine transaminase [Aristaeella hokkaidonensis]|uniref:Acetylornithine transaminase n=1 Tax=Aristaeella hokkaidonensis TaxID=3046382 RepID=A0AC61MZ00_9FIRM|nr:acetylornithine transaminase [Aristaeella hokkaidonensis]QUC68439.1 acetylornithine transaminase [Aristaeella hokkaidonensis]SNT94909.1 acetylornithine/N-succinyldiaminopimelate aminotransferase [Aristaeella hokkaidonensis]